MNVRNVIYSDRDAGGSMVFDFGVLELDKVKRKKLVVIYKNCSGCSNVFEKPNPLHFGY